MPSTSLMVRRSSFCSGTSRSWFTRAEQVDRHRVVDTFELGQEVGVERLEDQPGLGDRVLLATLDVAGRVEEDRRAEVGELAERQEHLDDLAARPRQQLLK